VTAKQHGAPAILLAKIMQVAETLHFSQEVIVEILQQEPHQRDVSDAG